MGIHYFDLNLNIPVFKNGVDLSKLIAHNQSYNYASLDYQDLISEELKNFFTKYKLTPLMVELFYLYPNNSSKPHIDIEPGDATKINWVIGGAGSTMNWYEERDNAKPVASITPVATNIIFFEPRSLKLIERYEIKGPTVVQTGVPHNVTAYREGRYCISIGVTDGSNTTQLPRLTMSRAKEIFADIAVP